MKYAKEGSKYYRVEGEIDKTKEIKRINDELVALDKWRDNAIKKVKKRYQEDLVDLSARKTELNNLNLQ